MGSDPKTAPDNYHEQSTESSFSARHSTWDDNQAWSSQEWKTDEVMEVRTGRLVNEEPLGLFAEHTDSLLLMTMIWTLTPSQNQKCR